jgi:thiol:disulfide interchange protein DsbA
MIRKTLLTLMCLLLLPLSVAAGDYTEGQHYRTVPAPVAPADPKIITVEEFFWYGCPHCYRLEPQLAAWANKQPSDVKLVHIPNSLGRPVGVLHQKTFFTAAGLGVEQQLRLPFMEALVIEHQNLNDEKSIRDFVVQHTGITPEVFTSNFEGFAVDMQVRRADELARSYRITGTPTLVVGGKYLASATLPGIHVPGATEEQSNARMLEVVDFLVDKLRRERKGS